MKKILFKEKQITINENQKLSNRTIIGFVGEAERFKARSKKYVQFMINLDIAELSGTKGMERVLNELQDEFGTADLANLPLGIVGKCFLGHPHEVHTLDLGINQIIQHYKIGEPLPENFEKARNLAKHNAYAFVEIYKDYLLLIKSDGTTLKF